MMNRRVFSSVLKVVRDEADRTLLDREFLTSGAHDEKQWAPITVRDVHSSPRPFITTFILLRRWLNANNNKIIIITNNNSKDNILIQICIFLTKSHITHKQRGRPVEQRFLPSVYPVVHAMWCSCYQLQQRYVGFPAVLRSLNYWMTCLTEIAWCSTKQTHTHILF